MKIIAGIGRYLHNVTLGGLFRSVSRADVSDFMGHHARKLGFFVRVQNQSAIYVKEATRQREGVHDVRIDHLDGEWNMRV